jgi:hypothetical protein
MFKLLMFVIHNLNTNFILILISITNLKFCVSLFNNNITYNWKDNNLLLFFFF